MPEALFGEPANGHIRFRSRVFRQVKLGASNVVGQRLSQDRTLAARAGGGTDAKIEARERARLARARACAVCREISPAG
jgi:hypothetical protein